MVTVHHTDAGAGAEIRGLHFPRGKTSAADYQLRVLWFEDLHAVRIPSDLEEFVFVVQCRTPDAASQLLAQSRTIKGSHRHDKLPSGRWFPFDIYVADHDLASVPPPICELTEAASAQAAGLTASALLASAFPRHPAVIVPYTGVWERVRNQAALVRLLCPPIARFSTDKTIDTMDKGSAGFADMLLAAIPVYRDYLRDAANAGLVHLPLEQIRKMQSAIRESGDKPLSWPILEYLEVQTTDGCRRIHLSALWPEFITGKRENAKPKLDEWLREFETPTPLEVQAAWIATIYVAHRNSKAAKDRVLLSHLIRTGMGVLASLISQMDEANGAAFIPVNLDDISSRLQERLAAKAHAAVLRQDRNPAASAAPKSAQELMWPNPPVLVAYLRERAQKRNRPRFEELPDLIRLADVVRETYPVSESARELALLAVANQFQLLLKVLDQVCADMGLDHSTVRQYLSAAASLEAARAKSRAAQHRFEAAARNVGDQKVTAALDELAGRKKEAERHELTQRIIELLRGIHRPEALETLKAQDACIKAAADLQQRDKVMKGAKSAVRMPQKYIEPPLYTAAKKHRLKSGEGARLAVLFAIVLEAQRKSLVDKPAFAWPVANGWLGEHRNDPSIVRLRAKVEEIIRRHDQWATDDVPAVPVLKALLEAAVDSITGRPGVKMTSGDGEDPQDKKVAQSPDATVGSSDVDDLDGRDGVPTWQLVSAEDIVQILDPLPKQILISETDDGSGRIGAQLDRYELDLPAILGGNPAGITENERRSMRRFAFDAGFTDWPKWLWDLLEDHQ